MNKYYDYIISLGNDCSIAGNLRKLKFKEASYPFDWNITSIHFILECIINKFDNIHKLIDKCNLNKKKKLYYNNEIIFQHENTDLEEEKKNIINKYKTRGKRLHELCLTNKHILFVRKGEKDTLDELEKIKKAFEKTYPTLKFKILLINNIPMEIDNNNTGKIINYNIDSDCFLEIDNNNFFFGASHRDSKKSYENVFNILSNFSSKEYVQPKYRDLL